MTDIIGILRTLMNRIRHDTQEKLKLTLHLSFKVHHSATWALITKQYLKNKIISTIKVFLTTIHFLAFLVYFNCNRWFGPLSLKNNHDLLMQFYNQSIMKHVQNCVSSRSISDVLLTHILEQRHTRQCKSAHLPTYTDRYFCIQLAN